MIPRVKILFSEPRPSGSCDTSRRRKRATGGGGAKACAFLFSRSSDAETSKQKGPLTLDEINSKNFIAEYTKVENPYRRFMTDVAETNSKKITGSLDDVTKINQLVEYEKMQKHNAKVKYAKEGLSTGESFGEKIRKDVDGYSESELLKDTKISPSKTALFFSKHPKLQKGIKNAGKVSGTLGKFLMAKSVVTGIARGDTTSLAIMGGRIGGEVFLEAFGKYGSKFATKVASKVGTKVGIKATAKLASSGLKTLGKCAGPIGSVADVGMSAWQLGKAIGRLNDPNATKFEQNEAIADIVQESVDIAITVTVTAISIAFPPLAPLVAVIGFFANLLVMAAVTLYKAINHVDSLNLKVKLLDYERDAEIGRYLIGQDTTVYLKDLIRTKTANNLIVNLTIKFLDDNEDHIGIVIPSRTFEFQAGCKLEGAVCFAHSTFIHSTRLCSGWKDTVTIASNCFEGGECSGSSYTCKSKGYMKLAYGTEYDWHKCVCDKSQETVLGNPHPDSKVDLRKKQDIYRDRSAPDELAGGRDQSSYDMFCTPSLDHFGGDFRSERISRYGYLCENAIGLKRQSGSGKFMLYDLGDGTDEIYLNPYDITANRFTVGDGHKTFVGSLGTDTFLISGPCTSLSGVLDGNGGGEDSLVVGHSCALGEDLKIDMSQGRFGPSGTTNHLRLSNISTVVTRSGESDHVVLDCGIKYLDTGGGKDANHPDVISFAKVGRVCEPQVHIPVRSYTLLNLDRIDGDIKVVLTKETMDFDVNYTQSHNSSSSCLIYFKKSVGEFSSISAVQLGREKYRVVFESSVGRVGEVTIHLPRGLQSQPQPQIVFENNENETPTSLYTDEKFNLMAVHRLLHHSSSIRNGAAGIPNYFELRGGTWRVNGGARNDEFVLVNNQFRGSLHGNYGENTLRIDKSYGGSSKIEVDLVRGVVGTNGDETVRLSGIHRVIGRPNGVESIHCNCAMHLVAGHGGGDDITVSSTPTSNCTTPLVILSRGRTNVSILSTQGREVNVVVELDPEGRLNSVLNLNLERERGKVLYSLGFPSSHVGWIRSSIGWHGTGFRLRLKSNNTQEFNLELTLGGESSMKNSAHEHWEIPRIQFHEENGPPSFLLVSRLSPVEMLGSHQLEDLGGTGRGLVRLGFSTIPNYFQLSSGNWVSAIGGSEDDTFQVQSETVSGSLDGRDGSTPSSLEKIPPVVLLSKLTCWKDL